MRGSAGRDPLPAALGPDRAGTVQGRAGSSSANAHRPPDSSAPRSSATFGEVGGPPRVALLSRTLSESDPTLFLIRASAFALAGGVRRYLAPHPTQIRGLQPALSAL